MSAEKHAGYQFGTFKGVFTPAILTIFGVIMYLRSGWVLGNVGLGMTVLIVTLATAITLLTSLSLSALATNTRVGGGGAYFMISRSLGVETGAAIGVPLYLAQAIGISFYVAGFAEAFCLAFPALDLRAVALVALVVMATLSYASADLALRVQFAILAIIVASLISFFAGGGPHGQPLPVDTPFPPLQPFWVVFAVFFPAVTGILSGVSMSGDLRDPAKAIPWGTLSAVLVSYAVYLLIPFYLHHVVADRRLLLLDPLIMRDVARWGWLILAGVWAASLSSALGSFLAAPRTLQALARDGVLPLWIGKGSGSNNDPRFATLLTFGIAVVALWLGALNAIAAVLTMFFLTTYGVINLCAGMEEMLGAPSWRPTFRVNAWLSLAGAAGCFATMLMIDAGAAIVSGTVVTGVYLLVKRRRIRRQWGDIRYGLLMLLIRTALYRLVKKRGEAHPWQPNILVLCGSPTTRNYLIELGSALAGDSNCLSVATVLPVVAWSAERIDNVEGSIGRYLQARGIAGLVKVLPADNLQTGAEALIKAYGFGPVTPNTIILGETEKYANYLVFAGLIRLVHRSCRNLIMVREGICELDPETNPRIDIWWKSDSENIGLMMLLGYLLKRSANWPDAQLSLKTVVATEADLADARGRLERFTTTQRIDLLTEALVANGRSAFDVIRESSRQAGLVFVGMRPPGEKETDEEYSRYYAWLLEQTRGLPPTAIVMAAEPIDFRSLYRR